MAHTCKRLGRGEEQRRAPPGQDTIHVALEAGKTAVAVALEILDTEVRWLASTRATTSTGLKLKASYASIEGASRQKKRGQKESGTGAR